MPNVLIIPRGNKIELTDLGVIPSPVPNTRITAFSVTEYYCVVARDVCHLYDTNTLDLVRRVRLAREGCDSVSCKEDLLVYKCGEMLFSVKLNETSVHYAHGPVLALSLIGDQIITRDGKRWNFYRGEIELGNGGYVQPIPDYTDSDVKIKYVRLPWSEDVTFDNVQYMVDGGREYTDHKREIIVQEGDIQYTEYERYKVMSYDMMNTAFITRLDGDRHRTSFPFVIDSTGIMYKYHRDTRSYIEQPNERYLGMLIANGPDTGRVGVPVRDDGVVQLLDYLGDVIEELVIEDLSSIDWSLFNIVSTQP